MRITPEELYHAARPVLSSGRAVSFHVAGGSMLPFLKPGAEVRLERCAEYRRGDVVLAMTDEGRAVVHYVARADDEGYMLMGAANLKKMERCKPDDIAGRVTQPRMGRGVMMIWHWMRPVRRYVMWIYRHVADSY